jgi:hypothetical protein
MAAAPARFIQGLSIQTLRRNSQSRHFVEEVSEITQFGVKVVSDAPVAFGRHLFEQLSRPIFIFDRKDSCMI